MLPCIFDFCSFCHNPNRQTVSNALLKSTKEQNICFPKEKYIAIRECKTKILSTVENPLLNPVCAPEISSTSSANLFNLLFRAAVNVLLRQELSVIPLYEAGSNLEPLFLYIGIIIPSVQLSGILPLSKITLNNKTYIANISSSVYLIIR